MRGYEAQVRALKDLVAHEEQELGALQVGRGGEGGVGPGAAAVNGSDLPFAPHVHQ